MQLTITIKNKNSCTGKITDRVKTFEDACEVLGIKGDILTGTLSDDLEGDAKSIAAYAKLIIIARALNEGWKPNWENSNEYKYYPYFKMQGGFVLDGVRCICAYTGVGSRLCFKTDELAKYAVKQFGDLYKDYFTQN